MAKRVYPIATILGTPLDNAMIAKVKSEWFVLWASWTLALEPGTLQVVPQGAGQADTVPR